MSIKANELQQVAALKGADPLLLGDSAGGTALLPVTELAKFLAEQDNAVNAALLSKAAKSAQETLELTALPSRSVEVAAADLPAYLAALPRLRTENLNITVTRGTVPGALELKNFYGPGFIWLWGSEGVEINGPVTISGCANYIRTGVYSVKGKTSGNAAVHVITSPIVALSDITIDGSAIPHSHLIGVRCDSSSWVQLENVEIKNTDLALCSINNGIISAMNCSGSGNVTGCQAVQGGIILLSGKTPDLMGGSSNQKGGGIIVNKNGTLL